MFSVSNLKPVHHASHQTLGFTQCLSKVYLVHTPILVNKKGLTISYTNSKIVPQICFLLNSRILYIQLAIQHFHLGVN